MYAMYCVWEATACDLFSLTLPTNFGVNVFLLIHLYSYSLLNRIRNAGTQKTEKANTDFEAEKKRWRDREQHYYREGQNNAKQIERIIKSSTKIKNTNKLVH